MARAGGEAGWSNSRARRRRGAQAGNRAPSPAAGFGPGRWAPPRLPGGALGRGRAARSRGRVPARGTSSAGSALSRLPGAAPSPPPGAGATLAALRRDGGSQHRRSARGRRGAAAGRRLAGERAPGGRLRRVLTDNRLQPPGMAAHAGGPHPEGRCARPQRRPRPRRLPGYRLGRRRGRVEFGLADAEIGRLCAVVAAEGGAGRRPGPAGLPDPLLPRLPARRLHPRAPGRRGGGGGPARGRGRPPWGGAGGAGRGAGRSRSSFSRPRCAPARRSSSEAILRSSGSS